MIEQHYLDESLQQLRKLKAQAENAIAQIDDEQFFPPARSRRQQHRSDHEACCREHAIAMDSTFSRQTVRNAIATGTASSNSGSGDTRDAIQRPLGGRLELRRLMRLTSLRPGNLGATVDDSGREPDTVVQAINRQFSHYSAHVGQIVLLAKHFAGAGWQTLSVPKAKRSGGL